MFIVLQTIDLNEARHGFIKESDWKEFSFVEGKGDLNIIAKKGQVTYRVSLAS